MIVIVFANLWVEPEPPPVDDEQLARLIAAAQVGNERAARQLYRLHVARVYRLVRANCESDHDAEELTQDTFVDALGALGRYQQRRGVRFVAWLTTLALNRTRKHHRRRPATPGEPKTIEALAGADGSQLDEGALLRRRALLNALAQLPERDRTLVSLFYGAELTAEEVADVLGLSAANVRKICERQRTFLLTILGEPHDP